MARFTPLLLFLGSGLAAAADGKEAAEEDGAYRVSGIYDLKMPSIHSEKVDFEKYRDKVLIVANLASQCGFTEAGYIQLNELHRRYSGKGLHILGFPCNQFGNQEPGTHEEILEFATGKGAEWEIFDKVEVNGPSAVDLYKMLKGEDLPPDGCVDRNSQCRGWASHGECEANSQYMHVHCARSCAICTPRYPFGGEVAWNFEYFLIGKDAQVLMRFPTGTDLLSADVIFMIEDALGLDQLNVKDDL